MNKTDLRDFIDKELKGRWPDWSPTNAEIEDWCGVLLVFEYTVAKEAVKQHCISKDKILRCPKMSLIIELAKKYQRIKRSREHTGEPAVAYTLVNDHRKYAFYVPMASFLESIDIHNFEVEAEKLREKLNGSCGKGWIIHWPKLLADRMFSGN